MPRQQVLLLLRRRYLASPPPRQPAWWEPARRRTAVEEEEEEEEEAHRPALTWCTLVHRRHAGAPWRHTPFPPTHNITLGRHWTTHRY